MTRVQQCLTPLHFCDVHTSFFSLTTPYVKLSPWKVHFGQCTSTLKHVHTSLFTPYTYREHGRHKSVIKVQHKRLGHRIRPARPPKARGGRFRGRGRSCPTLGRAGAHQLGRWRPSRVAPPRVASAPSIGPRSGRRRGRARCGAAAAAAAAARGKRWRRWQHHLDEAIRACAPLPPTRMTVEEREEVRLSTAGTRTRGRLSSARARLREELLDADIVAQSQRRACGQVRDVDHARRAR
jgi:hypothetical protein